MSLGVRGAAPAGAPVRERPLRILHLGKYYAPARGGIESHVQLLARGQAAAGHDVTVLCFNHRDRGARDALDRSFERVPESEELDGAVRVRRLGRWVRLFGTDLVPTLVARSLAGALSSHDVVHLHTPNPMMLAACASAPRLRFSLHLRVRRPSR